MWWTRFVTRCNTETCASLGIVSMLSITSQGHTQSDGIIPQILKEVNTLGTFRDKRLNVDLLSFLIGSAFDISYFNYHRFLL